LPEQKTFAFMEAIVLLIAFSFSFIVCGLLRDTGLGLLSFEVSVIKSSFLWRHTVLFF